MPGLIGTKIDILRRNKMTERSIRPTGTTRSGREKMKPQTLFCLLSSDGSLIMTASRQADFSVLIPLPSHFSNHLSQSTANHMSRGPGTTHTLKAARGAFFHFSFSAALVSLDMLNTLPFGVSVCLPPMRAAISVLLTAVSSALRVWRWASTPNYLWNVSKYFYLSSGSAVLHSNVFLVFWLCA